MLESSKNKLNFNCHIVRLLQLRSGFDHALPNSFRDLASTLKSSAISTIYTQNCSQRLSPMKHIELDGRTGEGGGQLVRVAIGLAALTSQSVKITNIRGNRPSVKGGGKLQRCVL